MKRFAEVTSAKSFLLFCCLSWSFDSAALASAATPEPVVRIVLRVNDRIATLHEYEERKAARIEAVASAQGLSTEERRKLAAEAGQVVLREIFEELLLLSRGDELRIRPTEAQVDGAIEATRERMGLRDPGEFEAALASSGMTLEDLRRRMRTQLVTSEVVDREVRSKIKLDDEQLLKRYQQEAERFKRPERRRLVELVVREEAFPGDREALGAMARQVADRLREGEALSEVAADLGSERVAGPIDHGWVARGELARELDDVAFELEGGGVSEPVPARGGLHVLKVLDIEPAGPIPFAEVKDRIRAEEGRRLFEERFQRLLEELAARAYVVENLPAEAQGYRTAPKPRELDQALAELAPNRKGRDAPAPDPGVPPVSEGEPEPSAPPAESEAPPEPAPTPPTGPLSDS